MDLDILGAHTSITINVFGYDIIIFQGLIYITTILLIMFFLGIILHFIIKKQDVIKEPSLPIIMLETLYNFSNKTVGNIKSDKNGKLKILLIAFIANLFVFLFLINSSGLLGIDPPASNFFIAFTLGLIVAISVHVTSLIHNPINYFKSYIYPSILFLPMNLIEVFSQVISISMRLFGNMLAGIVLSTLLKNFLLYINLILFLFTYPVIGGFLSMYSDLFIASIQTLIFTSLTAGYIKSKL